MFVWVREKVARIQDADPRIKVRWLVVASAGSMLIVIGLWLVAFNLVMPHAGEIRADGRSGELFSIIKGGAGVLKDGAASHIGRLAQSLKEFAGSWSARTVMIEE